MSDKSAIGWTDATWNPVRGCTKVSAGCRSCYAETFAERWRGVKGHPFEQGFDLRLVPEAIEKPLHWKKPRRIFVNSMSDLFHEEVPFHYISTVFSVMADCPQHTFQILTKRPARMLEALEWIEEHSGGHHGEWPLQNVHLGVSCENQETANERIPILLKCPAAIRWVSAEPLLGPLDLFMVDEDGGFGPGFITKAYTQLTDYGTGVEYGVDAQVWLDWVVVGGESGPRRRDCEVEWIHSIVEQCEGVGVPCFVKQDSGARSGGQGRLSDELWAIKQFPVTP
jgi:protein gp37